MYPKISDREGHSYDISISESDPLLLFRLYDRQTLVGEAKFVRESTETVLLGDIAIANEVILTPSNYWVAQFRKISGYKPEPINYRGKGLGSALIKFLIHHAHTLGIRHIYGKVAQQDLENNPKLLQWYQDHGFAAELPESKDDPDIIAWIHLNL